MWTEERAKIHCLTINFNFILTHAYRLHSWMPPVYSWPPLPDLQVTLFLAKRVNIDL